MPAAERCGRRYPQTSAPIAGLESPDTTARCGLSGAPIFPGSCYVAELSQRGVASLFGRCASFDVVLCFPLDVIADVSVEVGQRVFLHAGLSTRAIARCQSLPLGRFDGELLSALRRESIELRFAIVLGRALFERDPAPLDEAMERRVQGALFHLQDVVGAELDGLGDGVAVSRAGRRVRRISRSRVPCRRSIRS